MAMQRRRPDELPHVVAIAEALEIRTAQLTRALVLLDQLERIIPPGYMMPEYQSTIRDVEALLVEFGKRPAPSDRVWVDRTCSCAQLAEGTSSTRINPACVLHGQRL